MFANMGDQNQEGGEGGAGESAPAQGGRKRSRVGRVVKRLSEFLFSQVGLVGMVIGYTILGGIVFQHLEKTNEVHECRQRYEKYQRAQLNLIELLIQLKNNQSLESDNLSTTTTTAVAATTTKAIAAAAVTTTTTTTTTAAATAITTITAATTTTTLESVTGDSRARRAVDDVTTVTMMTSQDYDDVEEVEEVEEESAEVKEYRKILSEYNDKILEIDYDGVECDIKQEHGDWSLAGSMLFSVTVYTTIGYGNIAPRTYWGRLTCICYAMLGIPLMMVTLANLGSLLGDIFRFIYARIICCGCCVSPQGQISSSSTPRRSKPTNNLNKHNDDQNNVTQSGREAEPEEERGGHQQTTYMGVMRIKHGGKGAGHQGHNPTDQGRVTVPLCMSLGLIAGYLFFGSVLFGVWEGWDPLMSAYYCFVTISTIGFGDVVPGSTDFQSQGDGWKLGMASVYMLFGMALLSMCINLIQEGVIEKVRLAGQKLGLSDD